MATKKPTHVAVCRFCYTCIIKEGTLRECEQAATSHIHAYRHDVSILKKA